ncbi:SdrD B-like domain-containing protein [Neolewinella agarilytica]|nr:SdrD B-like domain-containing protein [Neolewinella agarilytica]
MVSVFKDFNGDGIRQSTEPPVAGVTVTAYDDLNALAAQDNIGNSGNYLLNVGAGTGTYRVEVTGLPVDLQPGAVGSSTVFFATANQTVAVALANPDQYSQPNPPLITTCFIEGPQSVGAGETLIRFDYDSGCFDAGINATCDDGGTFNGPKAALADASDIGSTFGVAYQRNTRSAFVASFMKRHAGFKENGKTGIIYRVQNPNTATPTITEYIDFDALGIPTQPLTGDPHPADNASVTDWELDNNSWDWVGKMSFGDLDISEDGETLYVVNLFDRQLYSFPAKATPYTAADAAMVTAIPLPQPCGNAIDARPFGLGVYNGKVYFSMICSGESSTGAWAGGKIPANSVCNVNTPPVGDRTALEANIYEYDPGTGLVNLTPVLNFPLNYGRGLAINSSYGATSATWNPWVSEWTVFNRPPRIINNTKALAQDRSYPQPMISDIEFDANGNMVLGLRDRFGDQTGHLQSAPAGFTINPDPDPGNGAPPAFENMYDGVAEGDILRACGDPTSGWTLESGGACGGISGPTAPNVNSNGPGGGEYYSQDDYDNFHNEIAQGGMVIVPGQEEVVTIVTDPINSSTEFYDAGIVWYRNSDGQRVQNFLVFSTAVGVGDDDGPTFAKANGLGDMIALSDPTPIQIGNRVWFDSNRDGIQTPDEPGLNGVLVELYKDIGGVMTKVAETTTSADPLQGNGAYKFTNSTEQTWSNGQTEVLPNMSYEIRVSLADVQSVENTVTEFTLPNGSGDSSNNNLSDLNDSDANSSGVIAFQTGGAGENNHTLDIGARVGCSVSGSIVSETCDGMSTPVTADDTYDIVVTATVTNGSGAYDVLVDGLEVTAAVSSGTQTTITLPASGTTVDISFRDATDDSCMSGAITSSSLESCSPAIPCDVSITNVRVACANETEFMLTFDVNWDYILATTDMIQVTVNGVAQAPFTPLTPAGTQAFGPFSFNQPANGLLMEASFTGLSTCSTIASADLIACTDPCTDALGGNVFNDFNNDGADAGASEVGQSNVLVEVYECDNDVPVATTYTNADGDWSVDDTNITYPVRVEFSTPLQDYLQPGVAGMNNGTNVQFVEAPTCQVIYGVLNPSTYCGEDVSLVTTCYLGGDNTGGQAAVLTWSYENVGLGPNDKRSVSTVGQVASAWGASYNTSEKELLVAAVLKRHSGLHYEADGSGGLDAIYAIDPFSSNPNGTIWLELDDDLGIDVGSIPDNAGRGLGAPTAPSNDVEAYDKAGKVGIGDIDLSEDNSRLYVMNLFDKTLYEIDVATKTLVNSYPVPDPGCANGDYRPWAVQYHKGKVYVGSICDGSEAGKNATAGDALTNETGRSDLRAYVYKLSDGTFNEVLDFSLDYTREPPDQYNGSCNTSDGWFPWVQSNEVPLSCVFFNPTNVIGYPQPLLTDIEFTDSGDMILGFLDRTGLQIGNGNYGPTGTTLYGLASSGDILHACADGAGGFTLESPECANVNGHFLNSDSGEYNAFPDGHGEYYGGDFFHNNGTFSNPNEFPGHSEITLGGLAVLSGSGEVIANAYDPVTGGNNFGTGGIIRLSTTTGMRTSNGFQLYDASDVGTFGKGVGIGDLEIICGESPIQIGNYAWVDTDEDGVQDACEEPVENLPVSLYTKDDNGDLTLVATTTTTADGEYYFTGDGTTGETWTNIDDVILKDTTYLIVFGDAATAPTDTTILAGGVEYTITADSTGEGNSPGLNDSDAILMNVNGTMLPAICYSTADTTDHTLDVGLKSVAFLSIGSTVFEDLDNNALQDVDEDGIPNVELVIYQLVGNKDDATNGETDDILLDVGSDGDLSTATDGMPLVTDANGDYLVTGLQPGDYYLVIPSGNFADGEALNDISISSTDIATSAADNQRDGDDNGLQPAGPATEVCSPVITLSAGDEPEDGTDPDEETGSGSTQDNASPLRDDNGDMTVDFGFFRPLSIGSTVFEDLDNNALQDVDEDGIPNVELVIYQLVGNKDDATNGETDDILLDVGSDGDLSTTTDGMPLLTDANGDYLVTGLQPGDYYLVIPSGNFADGEALNDISISSTDIATSAADNQRDGDDNGLQPAGPATEVCSPVITLSAGDEPEDGTDPDEETGSGSTQDNASPLRDDNGDMTVDFGFFRPLSIGSTVFEDGDNSGRQDAGEAAIPNVVVQLFRTVGNKDDDINRETDDTLLDAGSDGDLITPTDGLPTTTNSTGDYLFTGLTPDEYYVVIPTSEFGVGEPLEVLNVSSYDIATSLTDNQIDGDDNGQQPAGRGTAICSPEITLSVGDEPINGSVAGTEVDQGNVQDDATAARDANGDMTIDMGLFAPVCLGDTAFIDIDGDGIQSVGDEPLPGVVVTLYESETMMPFTGMDVNGNTVDPLITNMDGAYKFTDLPPGDYYVVFDISMIANADLYEFTIPNQGDDIDDSDAIPDGPGDDVARSESTGGLDSGEEFRNLDVGVTCAITVEVSQPFTICSTQPINLLEGASVSPERLGGVWSTSDGTGSFVDVDGNALLAPFELGIAAEYLPSREDGLRGFVTFVLSSGDPGELVPPSSCATVSSAALRIEVLNVDCGQLLWDGK